MATGFNYNAIKNLFIKSKKLLPEEVRVQFLTHNVDGKAIPMCMSLDRLYEDWYEKCIFCPENDAHIEVLWIITKHGVDAATNEELEDFTFEEMMHIIDEVW